MHIVQKVTNAMMLTDDSAVYDLEYRAKEDDAWYSVCVVLDAGAETLRVKYMCDPEVYDVVFSAADFVTEAMLEELIGRFRPVSRQLQDNECLKLSVGTPVCASHGNADGDLRFFDAIVDAVEHRTHSFAGGEEECLCTFVLYWQHGRCRGTLTSTSIGCICVLEPATDDPRVSAFMKMAKKKIMFSKSKSKSTTPLKLEASLKLESPKTEDSGKMSNYKQWTSHDEDMGPTSCIVDGLDINGVSNYKQWTGHDEDMVPKSCNVDGSDTSGGHFFILIDNLEKDLNPSSIEKFIFEKTSILPEAFVYPRQLSDPIARGLILVDCENKAQTIYEFLDNPNHFVVSSRGRPWVIKEKVPAITFGANVWNLIPASREEIYRRRPRMELDVVLSGTESYKRAQQLRNLFVELLIHESNVIQRLVWEENKILASRP